MFRALIAISIVSILFAVEEPLSAQATPSPWRLLAEADARAAIELIEQNHPGAEPALGDEEFANRLRTARDRVAQRLPRVDSYPAYDALMSGLAADFGDGHIWSTPLVSYPYRAWAGIILGRRAGAWVVLAQEREGDDPPLIGHRLASCDGIDADRWGRERIGLFRGNPDIEAIIARHSAWLLVRDGNPFLDRPKNCTFISPGGDDRAVTLRWRQTESRDLEKRIAGGDARATAGMGVQPFASGYWIKLETLEDGASEVVTEIERRQSELRSAAMVVVDLRGNGGGDSAHAVAIARTLAGPSRLDAVSGPNEACTGSFWRASAGNLETLKAWRDRLANGDQQSFAYVSGLVQDMEGAIAERRPFTPELPSCARKRHAKVLSSRPAIRVQPSPIKGRLVLITDRSCFSSCLIAADLFRRLGALHVGESTDVSTRYMEVRQEVLPSGIRTFSTLQKVALGAADFGPYEPAIEYPGDLADTAALQRWVARLPSGLRMYGE